MKVDFIASEQHFITHLKPIWDILPDDIRGNFFVRSGLKVDIPYHKLRPFNNVGTLVRKLNERESNNFILGAGYGEVSKLKQYEFPMILMEHGSGQRYKSDHPSYSSGKGAKHNVVLFLSPNEYNAQGHREHYPNTLIEVVGSPKLDDWAFKPKPKNEIPIVCISFHWNCHIVPETRTTWEYYMSSFEELAAATEFKIIGHGHPRIFNGIRKIYDQFKIETYSNFEDIVEIADVYVCDNSSTIFEFAYLDRPVVLLNAPFYRRHVNHGLRFWEFSDIGFNCNRPSQLKKVILKAINEDHLKRNRRREAINQIYPYKGHSTQVTVGKLLNFVKNFPHSEAELKRILKKRMYNYRHSINPLYTKKSEDYMKYIKRSNQAIYDLQKQEQKI